MLDLFRDPLWQFVGVLLALAAIAGSFIIYFLQRQRKSISYEVISKNQLLTVGEELAGKLQVLYEGEPATDICLLVLKLSNSGNQPVAMSDYERPISLGTGTHSRILSVAVTEKDPEALSVELTVEQSRVVLQPLLLNSNDFIILKLLVSDFGGAVIADARIVGVKGISKASQNSGYSLLAMVSGLVVSIVGSYFVFSNVPGQPEHIPLSEESKFGIVVFTIGYATMVLGLMLNKQSRMIFLRLWKALLP